MKIKSCQNKNSVVFYCDDELVIKVDKQKLLAKSAYFRAMFKKCYKHHKSDSIDVYYPEKEEIFRKVMQFLTNGSITLDINSIYETYHLAVYLQIDCLQQLCLDHFTLNLNRNTLQSQLDLIATRPCLYAEFERRALMFEKSGSVSVSGLYFLQENRDGSTTSLKMKSKHAERVHVLEEFSELTDFGELHCVDNVLCSMASEDRACVLFQYDVVSGNASRLVLDIDDEESSTCAGKGNLYLFNQVESGSNGFNLSLSMLRKDKDTGSLKVCKTKNFCLPRFIYNSSEIRIYFSHCYDDKLYLFYHMPGRWDSNLTFYNIFLLVFCSKTFRVLKNQRMFERNARLDNVEEMSSFEKLFCGEKREKLFIRAEYFDASDFNKQLLVFDLKRESVYFYEDFHHLNGGKFATCKGGRVHAVSCHRTEVSGSLRSEVRAFKFGEYGLLVGEGVAWEKVEEQPSSSSDGRVLSACFV